MVSKPREVAGKLIEDYLYLVPYDLAIDILSRPRSRFGIPSLQSSMILKTIEEVSATPQKTFADIVSVPEEDQARYASIFLWLQRLGKLAVSFSELGEFGGFGDHDCDWGPGVVYFFKNMPQTSQGRELLEEVLERLNQRGVRRVAVGWEEVEAILRRDLT